MPSDAIETNETEIEMEATHVVVDGVLYRYVKKVTRILASQYRMDHKNDSGEIIPTDPVLWMHIRGYITQGEVEQGEETDYIRFFGLFQIEARNPDDSFKTVVTRNLIIRDIEDHLLPFFSRQAKRQIKNSKSSKNPEYFGLPDFHEVRINLELLCTTPKTPNRRGFDIEVRQVTPTVCVYSLSPHTSAAEKFEVDKPRHRKA